MRRGLIGAPFREADGIYISATFKTEAFMNINESRPARGTPSSFLAALVLAAATALVGCSGAPNTSDPGAKAGDVASSPPPSGASAAVAGAPAAAAGAPAAAHPKSSTITLITGDRVIVTTG